MESRREDHSPQLLNGKTNDSSITSSPQIPNIFTEEQITSAKMTAKEVGPRVYELTGFDSDEILIYVFGCQGDPGLGQLHGAKLMSDAALRKKPVLIFNLGDYTYPHAMTSPNDPRFQTHFYDLYANKKLYPGIADIPMIGTEGNHDGNHYKGFTSFIYKGDAVAKVMRYESGEEAELNLLANSYLVHKSDPITSYNRKEFYKNKTLPIDQLPKFDIPYFFHARIIGNKQIFFINSNSLAMDYLKSSQTNDPNNQIKWLVREYKKAKKAGREIIFAQHQPLNAIDKRARESGGDAALYFPTNESDEKLQEIAKLLGLSKVTKNYSKIISLIYTQLGLIPKVLLCAHHHCLSSFNNIGDSTQTLQFCQITSGAAGGKLQGRESFAHYDEVFYLEGYGYVEMTFNKNNLEPIQYALVTQQHRLEFSTADKHPLVHSKYNFNGNQGDEDNLAEAIRELVLDACDDYQMYLENKQDPEDDSEYSNFRLFGKTRFRLPSDVANMHSIMAFLLNPEPTTLEVLIISLCSKMNEMPLKEDANALYQLINKKMKHHPFIHMTLQELRDEYASANQPRL